MRLKNRPIRFITKRYSQDEEGVTAVEFAMVGPIFFFILFTILELSLVFFGMANVEFATSEASRILRTGQAQNQNFNRGTQPDGSPFQGDITRDEFVQIVCSKIFLLSDCENKLQVEVKSFDSFDDIDPVNDLAEPTEIDPATGLLRLKTSGYDFTPPDSCQPAIVRTFIEWDLIAQLPKVGVTTMDNGNMLMIGSTIFQSEPFKSGCAAPGSGN